MAGVARGLSSLGAIGKGAHASGGDVGAQALAVVAAVEMAAFWQAGGISVELGCPFNRS